MNETTATIQFIHDTLRVHDTLRSLTAHTPESVSWFEIAKWLFTAILSIASALGLWKYAFHPRKVAKEKAFVSITDAQQAADSRVIEAESKSESAKHDSVAEIISFWERSAKTLEEQNGELRAELAVAYSQATEATKKSAIAEATVEILQKKIADQEFEIISLKERLAADAEILAEYPGLQKMVSHLLEEKRQLHDANEKILNKIAAKI
jgi:hypothetical protein